jgi:hypothetical protein
MWGSGGIASPFLTSALDGGKLSASRHCRFSPWERGSGIYWVGGWVDPGAGLDDVEKRNLAPAGNRTSAVHPVACRDTN